MLLIACPYCGARPELEFVTANGDVRTISREKDSDKFPGAVVNLGALGAVTKVTLDIQPTYMMRQYVKLSNLDLRPRPHGDQAVMLDAAVSGEVEDGFLAEHGSVEIAGVNQ